MKRVDIRLIPVYFVIGGLTVSVAAYLGSHGKGLIAAFAGLFPGITLITFAAIYLHSGSSAVSNYARGTLILLPAWIVYIVGVMFLTPRVGIAASLASSIAMYLIVAVVILKLT
jgi:uncharacterized membrane protein (GlpM family)